MEHIQAAEFQSETQKIFENISLSCENLADSPGDQDLLYKNYLYWHEIKSMATLFGLEDIAVMAHDIENRFDPVTRKRETLTGEDLLQVKKACEYIKQAVQAKIYDEPLGQDFTDLFSSMSQGGAAIRHTASEQGKAAGKRDVSNKILIIEDDPINMALLEDNILRFRNDLKIVAAYSAEEGLYHFFTDKFALIFLDIMMPVIDGNDFIAIVEKNLLKKNVVPPCNIVVQSAVKSMSQLTALARRECVQEIIRKPINNIRIKECIERYCPPQNANLFLSEPLDRTGC